MSLKQKFQQQQKAVFTQSLRQSMKILELPLLELKDTIDAELLENPVLEEVSSTTPEADNSNASSKEREQQNSQEDDRHDFEKEIQSKETADYERPIANRSESLHDVLLRQLRINTSSEDELKIGTCLILHIDANGYLDSDILSLVQEAGCSQEEAEKTLGLIQNFEPAGIGARNLKECLFIQLKK